MIEKKEKNKLKIHRETLDKKGKGGDQFFGSFVMSVTFFLSPAGALRLSLSRLSVIPLS